MAAKFACCSGLYSLLALISCPFFPLCTFGLKTDPRNEFVGHAMVYPTIFAEKREKRDLHSMALHHEEKLTLGFVAFNKSFVVDLLMNKDLFPIHYFEKHHKDGNFVIHQPMKKGNHHCHYHGHIKGIKHTWAAISTCKGISGVIYDGEELHYIAPDQASDKNLHFLFRASDIKPQNLTCGSSDHMNLASATHAKDKLARHRRSTVLQSPYKSNSKSRFVELIIVNDHKEFKKFNLSKETVFERSKQIANIVNGLYSPLNIFIALAGVIIWSEHDEIKLSTDGDVTLTNFLHYRRERLALEHPNDNAQLITAMTFDGGVVGKALKGPICTYEYSGGVNMDHSDLVGLVATTVAHELGHNFGMEHDTDECQCPDDKCIMSPSSSSTTPQHWSSCSLEYLDLAYTQGMDYCLKNRPLDIIGPVCGNGFLETGEECDCGLKEFCDNYCCNATSCQLHSNASCAIGGCCDINTCQMMKTATLCRDVVSECDLPEYCNGKSEFCPSDTFQQNGKMCGNGKAYCYDGKCHSHADQCKLLWGQTGKMSDSRCYEQNYKGNVNGNCGYNRLNQTYKACGKQDILCGMLHCTHLNERLEFGMESAAILARSFINVKGKIFTCRSAIVDLGLYNTDPGLAPNGAKCSNEKVCVNQKCVPVSSIKGTKCPMHCSGNGVCNNKGNCHCEQGYEPPYCNMPGAGGSIDSGPASNYGGYVLVVATYVIFFGLVPLIILTASAMFYFRSHLKSWWIRKARKASIKCKAKQTVQRKPPQPPSKFNCSRNSLRTLEISAPIQLILPSAQNSIDSNASTLLERTVTSKVEISSPLSQYSTNNMQQPNRPVPVRPAPPRPSAPSWTPGGTNILPAIRQTVSLGGAVDCNVIGRPLSISMSRPNCPPPRPPLPKSNIQLDSVCSMSEYLKSDLKDTEQSSNYYDDCQTLDFSNTSLAFVHQTSNPSSVNLKEDVTIRPKQSNNKTITSKSGQGTFSKPMPCSRIGQASLVASLAQKFENQKILPRSETRLSARLPIKSTQLPSTKKNSEA